MKVMKFGTTVTIADMKNLLKKRAVQNELFRI